MSVSDSPDWLPLEEPERWLSEELQGSPPVPSPGYRGALERYLDASDPGYGPRPPRLRLTVAAYLAVGLVLMALGALSALGLL